MALDKECGNLITKLGDMARAKNYRSDYIDMIAMLICTKEMLKIAGNYRNAILKATGFCEQSATDEECLTRIMEYLGVDVNSDEE